MERDRFNFETIAYVVVGVLCLWSFTAFYDSAFPQASIRLEVTRVQAVQIAARFLKQRGFDVSTYTQAAVFDADDTGAVFLQKTQGMKAANRLMSDKAHIWCWRNRWFKSGEKEGFEVRVSPRGQVIEYSHTLKDDAKGASIAQAQAETLARSFLVHIAGVNLANFERVQASSRKQENRTDHFFEWKEKGFDLMWKPGDPEAGAGQNRISVSVAGDQISRFSRYFKTPEAFERDYQKITSKGQLLAVISVAMMLFTLIAAVVVFVLRYKVGDIRWRFALVFTILVAVLMILGGVNSFPVIKMNYATTMEYEVYFGILLVGAIMAAAVYGAIILLTGASGESLTRELYPRSVETIDQVVRGRVFTRAFLFSAVRGYAFGFFFLGYITLFYLVGRERLGVFIPAEGPYSNLLSDYLPWLAPLSMALMAAVSEEFVSRFFSVPFLKKYLKWTPAALTIPAAIWAFGHSNYPVYPVYVRGIELTIAGILFGVLFIRYGIMDCIIAHYVIDAVMFGLPLLRSGNTYYVVSGAIVCLLAAAPLVLGIPGLVEKKPPLPKPGA